MSLESAQARVESLRALIGTALGGPQAPSTGPTKGPAFDQVLGSVKAVRGGGATVPARGATDVERADGPAAGARGAKTPFAAEIDAAAAKHKVDPALLRGLIRQESNFNPKAGSPAGAQGLTQLMPGTARSLGVSDPFDPKQAIEGGAKYLRQQLDRFDGDVRKALAAYNAGPGAVQRYGGVPPYRETQDYVRKVMEFAREYRTAAPRAAGPERPLAMGSGKIT